MSTWPCSGLISCICRTTSHHMHGKPACCLPGHLQMCPAINKPCQSAAARILHGVSVGGAAFRCVAKHHVLQFFNIWSTDSSTRLWPTPNQAHINAQSPSQPSDLMLPAHLDHIFPCWSHQQGMEGPADGQHGHFQCAGLDGCLIHQLKGISVARHHPSLRGGR